MQSGRKPTPVIGSVPSTNTRLSGDEAVPHVGERRAGGRGGRPASAGGGSAPSRGRMASSSIVTAGFDIVEIGTQPATLYVLARKASALHSAGDLGCS